MSAPALRELHDERANYSAEVATLEAKIADVDKRILAATREAVSQMFALSGKQSGTVTVAGTGGVEVRGSVSKKVAWDSSALMSVASGMQWDLARQIFDIEFTMPEKTYARLQAIGLSPEAIKAITAARTTKYGEIKVTLEVKE